MPVHLHVHSWYSLLEGTSSPAALLDCAAAGGHDTLALTDTNNLYGAVPFVEEARRRGLRPLLGACLRQQRTRCVVLIGEPAGYASLCRILTRLHLATVPEAPASIRGGCHAFAAPPVVDRATIPDGAAKACHPRRLADLLCLHAEGLHVLADDAVLAERLHDAFGNRLWLEIVRPGHGGARHEQELLACGRRLGLRPVASAAAHFAAPDEYPTFRLVTAVRQTTLLDQLPRALPITPAHCLASADEMRRRFADLPAALRGADDLAERMYADVLPRELVLPPPRVPHCLDAVRFLRLLCERGLRRRGLADDPAARDRLRGELGVLEPAGLSGYFLTVRDIARYARRRGHSMALRGSAGNSLVCYLLDITDVNPLRFNLAPERFLHPGRVDLPDIDLDFDWKVRDEVIDYVFRRYGSAHVARISSHLFLQPRSAFREAAKVHGLSNEQISRLLEAEDRGQRTEDGAPSVGEEAFSLSPVFPLPRFPAGFPLEPARWPRLVADARRLLGRPQHLSIHCGGVVITPGPIEDHVPLQMAPKGVVITQFEKDAIEYVGLVKIDLLGNRALATVDEARRWLADRGLNGARGREAEEGMELGDEKQAGTQYSVLSTRYSVLADTATIALLQRGDTLGVNQLESPAMRHLLIQMRPRGVEDVIQALALIRPGAASGGMKECFVRRRRGLDPVRVAHPCLADVLGETQGLMLYEDDALHLIRALTGLPVPEADRFRKRVTRHRTADEARALEAEFHAMCQQRRIPAAVAAELWTQLAKFNRYSFCKSHAVSYGLIAWTAAYLKAHHPLAFWTAALNNNQGCYPRRVYIEAAKRAGLALRLPCVNRSAGPFRVEDEAIRVGLGAIAGLPEELIAAVLADRERRGPYHDLADFRQRLRPGPEALALLIRCGALDGTGRARPALFLEAELQALARPGGAELFAWSPADDWSPDDYPARQRLRDEWELLGFAVGPPLLSLLRKGAAPDGGPPFIRSDEVANYAGRRVRVLGVVATYRHTFTDDGRPMQFVTLEDEDGLTEVTIFPGACPPVANLTLGPYVVTGVVEEQYGVFTVTAQSFKRLSD